MKLRKDECQLLKTITIPSMFHFEFKVEFLSKTPSKNWVSVEQKKTSLKVLITFIKSEDVKNSIHWSLVLKG